MVNFTLEQFNSSVELDLCGNISQGYSVDVSYDAIGVLYAKTSDMKKVFKIATDSYYINDSSSNEVKFYVFMDNWPDSVSLNPANAMMDQTESKNAISTQNSYGVTYDSTEMLVKHDYIRYLAQTLFGTAFGVDLFSNEIDLLVNLSTICGSTYSSYALYQINDALNSISTDEGTNSNLFTDASGYYYLTDDYDSDSNICRELYYQLLKTESDRFSGLENTSYPQGLPFLDGDTINYTVTINAAENQESLTGISSIPSRTYLIKLIMVSDTSTLSNVSSSSDSVTTYTEVAVTSTGSSSSTDDSNTILSFNGSTIKNVDLTPFLDPSSEIFQNLTMSYSEDSIFNTAFQTFDKTTITKNDVYTALSIENIAPEPAPAPAPIPLSQRITKFSEIDELLGLAPPKPKYVPPVYQEPAPVIPTSITFTPSYTTVQNTLSRETIANKFADYDAYFSVGVDTLVNYIIVGGGGGGGGGSYGSKNNSNGGAGGSGGQVLTGVKMLYANTVYTVKIGSGGKGGLGGYGKGENGTDGSYTSFADIVAKGGRGGHGGKSNTNGLYYLPGANGYIHKGKKYGDGGNAVCGGVTYNDKIRVGKDGLTFTYGNNYTISLGAGGGGGGSDTAYSSGAIYGYGGTGGSERLSHKPTGLSLPFSIPHSIGGSGAVAGSIMIPGSDASANTGSGGGGGGGSSGKGLTYINGYNGADGCVHVWFDRFKKKDTTHKPKIEVDDLSSTAVSVKFENHISSATSYNVSWVPNTPGAYVDTSSSDFVTIYDLSANTQYTIIGTVTSKVGKSVEAYATVTTPPSAPTVVITDACYTQIEVEFKDAPSDTTAYDLIWSPYTVGSAANTTTNKYVKITGLASDTSYSIYGYITTPQGTSSFSPTVSATTLVFTSYLGSFSVFGEATNSSIPLSWSGYYTYVLLSYSLDNITFTELGTYTLSSVTVDSLETNTTYYFSAVPINDAGTTGTALTAFYTTMGTISDITFIYSDVSAVMTFDGSFSSVDLSYNGEIRHSYASAGSTHSDISGLMSNYTYTLEVIANNSAGSAFVGNTIVFTTLPKIYSYNAYSVDSSSITIAFDSSFSSVNMYSSSVINSYTGTHKTYHTSHVYYPGLQPNSRYYFKAIPYNSAGANGYFVKDITSVTLSSLTQMAAQSVYDVSARLVFNGVFTSVDISYDNVQLTYFSPGTTNNDIKNLLPNKTYTINTSSKNFVGVPNHGNTVVFTTMPRLNYSYTYAIDASTVGVAFDGSFASVNIYISSTAGSYSGGYYNFTNSPVIFTGLNYNFKNFFKLIPVGKHSSLGYSISDISGVTYAIIKSFSVVTYDSSAITLTWDGSFSSVNIYNSFSADSYTGSAANYTTKSTLHTNLLPNAIYYYMISPVGLDGKTGVSILNYYANTNARLNKMAVSGVYDSSAVIVFDGSFARVDICNNIANLNLSYYTSGNTGNDIRGLLPNKTYYFTTDAVNTSGAIVAGNTVTFTTMPKLNYLTPSLLDSSSIKLTWDGSFASVNIYYSTTSGSYTGAVTNILTDTKTRDFNGLIPNTRYYFKTVPLNTINLEGYMISDVSNVTYPKLLSLTASTINDLTAILSFNGYFNLLNIYYSDYFNNNINLKYYANGNTGTDISGLMPNYTYTITSDVYGMTGLYNGGISIQFTTLPNIKSFTCSSIDSSSVYLTWDGSFASVNIYTSTSAGSYSGSPLNISDAFKYKTITGLNANVRYFFRIIPIGKYGATGTAVSDISTVTYPKQTLMAVSDVYDVSAVISFAGSYSYVDICNNTFALKYTTQSNTGKDISGLLPNYEYTFTTDSVNSVGYITAGNTVSFTTLPKLNNFQVVGIDKTTNYLTWDGSYASVNIYRSTVRNTFNDSPINYTAGTNSATITGINANLLNFYMVYPVGTYSAIGYAIDSSAIFTTDFSFIPTFTYTMINASDSAPIETSYFPELTLYSPSAYDSSSAYIIFDGSFEKIYVYNTTTEGSYDSNYVVNYSKELFVENMLQNATTYFKFVPIGELGTQGYTVYDISVNTYSYLSNIYPSAIYDTSVVFVFDGSFTSMDICYNDFYNNVQLTYFKGGDTGLDISGLLPNYTYYFTSDSANLVGSVTAGKTNVVTTLPKIYSYSVSMIDSSSVYLTWDGSFASVVIYSSITSAYNGTGRSYVGNAGVFNGLAANTSNYFKIVPVGTYGALGYSVNDLSAITMADITSMTASGVWDTSATLSFTGNFTYVDICYNDVKLTYYNAGNTGTDISGLLPNYTYTVTTGSVGVLGLMTTGNTVVFTTRPKIYSFGASTIDSSSAQISWDGSFASVLLYTSTTKSSYTGTSTSFTGTTGVMNGLQSNVTNYFKVVPVGTYGALGYGVMDISVVTLSKITKMTASAVLDTSATIAFDGSFTFIDICYNDYFNNPVQLVYSGEKRSTGKDISGLMPNYTYSFSSDSINPYGVVSQGNTISITTLPKITSLYTTVLDSSSILVTWDGSYASVNLYSSTIAGSYTGTATNYTASINSAYYTGLTNFNYKYYFKAVPVGTYGALGYGVMDASAVTYPKQTLMAASAVWDTSATISFDGYYSYVDICYNGVSLRYYTRPGTTNRDISNLIPDTTYTITTDSVNANGVIVAGNAITFTTLPKMTWMNATAIDISTIVVEWDGSFASVNLYNSYVASTYTDPYTNYDNTIKTTTITGLNANVRNYFKFVPIGTYGALGYGIMDISAMLTVDLSSLSLCSVTLFNPNVNSTVDNNIKITTFAATPIDSSSILVSWDGSYSTVTVYSYTTYGYYTSGTSYTYNDYNTKSILFNNLSVDVVYYYAITCYGDGFYGAPIYDLSGATMPSLATITVSEISDTSAILIFDGSFAAIDLCFNDYVVTIDQPYPNGIVVNDLLPNQEYTLTPYVKNTNGYIVEGDALMFTTLPKITSYSVTTVDSSSVLVLWDGSYSTIQLYTSIIDGSYSDTPYNTYTSADTNSVLIDGLVTNTYSYYKLIPIGIYGSVGTTIQDISNITATIMTKLELYDYCDVSATLSFSGVYDSIDISLNNGYTFTYYSTDSTTGTDISNLTPNTTYTITSDSKNANGYITSGNTITFTTLPNITSFTTNAIDSSTVELSFSGTKSSVNLYTSTIEGNYSSYVNYTNESSIIVDGLDANTIYYFKLESVGLNDDIGNNIGDISAVTYSIITSFQATSIDTSSVQITLDGSYNYVELYSSTNPYDYGNAPTVYDTSYKNFVIDGLNANEMYYYKAVPIGTTTISGDSLYDSANTYSFVLYVSTTNITDSSAVISFDGSYDIINFDYLNDDLITDVSYTTAGSVTFDNLLSNFTYTVTTTSTNEDMQESIYGTTWFTTLPKITSYSAQALDNSSASITWDGSFSSVSVYTSDTTPGNGYATIFSSSVTSAIINNLKSNTTYYFFLLPHGKYGANGIILRDSSGNITEYSTITTLPIITSYSAVVYDASSIQVTWDGSFASVDIYTSNIAGSYTGAAVNYSAETTSAIIDNLDFNEDYYFKIIPINTNNVYGSAIYDFSAETLSIITSYSAATYDSSAVSLTWDGSFNSVKLYISDTAGSYTSFTSYTNNSAIINGLSSNVNYYFKIIPIGNNGSSGVSYYNFSAETLPKVTSYSVATYDSSAVSLAWDGSFASLNLYLSTAADSYSSVYANYSSNTKTAIISNLDANTNYYFKFVPISTNGNSGDSIINVSQNTKPKITSYSAATYDSSAVSLTWDGSFTNVNIYISTTQGSYTGSATNYTSGTTAAIFNNLQSNTQYYFKLQPVGINSTTGTEISNVSTVTMPILTTYSAATYDDTTIKLTLNGSFASVNVYVSNTQGSYTSSYTNYSVVSNTVTITSLESNKEYFFKVQPVGTYGALGTAISDLSAITKPRITSYSATVFDTSAITVEWDGSFSSIELYSSTTSSSYTDSATVYSSSTKTVIVKNLVSDKQYFFMIKPVGINGAYGLTISNFNAVTNPILYSYSAATYDSSAITLTWDGSFASVNVYSSTTSDSYTGTATNYTSSTKTSIINGLSSNATYYFKIVPVGTYSAIGTSISNISAITKPSLTKTSISVYDSSAISLTWDGSFASVNLYSSTTAGSYTGSATNYSATTKSVFISSLSNNTKYYFKITPVGSNSDLGTAVSDLSGTTLSKVDTFISLVLFK